MEQRKGGGNVNSQLLACAVAASLSLACGNGSSSSDAATTDAPIRDAAVPDVVVADAGPDAPAPADASPDARPCSEEEIPTDIDVLFVIDNSPGMLSKQSALMDAVPAFLEAVECRFGVLPNLHVGVISTDLGAGPWGIAGCSGNGDNGVLQNAPRIGGCSPPAGKYISDIDDGAGGRITNYTGTLAGTFSCIAQLGATGCGFEQPLDAMRRALNGSNPENSGFLRSEATLAVFFLSDEDDCSTEDTQLFDTSQTSIDDPLGPLSSFRCFEFGVVCTPDNPREFGAKEDCVPREDSLYMFGVQAYVDFLLGLKAVPTQIVVAGIMGESKPVVVIENDYGNPDLEPSCSVPSAAADPGVRLQVFLDGFPRSSFQTICSEELGTAMWNIAELFA
jgi:hypothetical protein